MIMTNKQKNLDWDWQVRLNIILESFYKTMIAIDVETGRYTANEVVIDLHPQWHKEAYKSAIEQITRVRDMLHKKDKVMEIASLFPESSMTADKYSQIKKILESK